MSYRDLDTETLKRRIAELVELRRELDAQLEVLTGMRGRRTPTWFPKLVLCFFTGLAVFTVCLCWVTPSVGNARVRVTNERAASVAGAASLYVTDHLAEGAFTVCPSAYDLVEEGYLRHASPLRDAWDRDFRVQCDANEVRVTSPGPDGRFGTVDDIG